MNQFDEWKRQQEQLEEFGRQEDRAFGAAGIALLLILLAVICIRCSAAELIDTKRAEIVDAFEEASITSVRLKTERIEGHITHNGWGTAVTWRGGILTAWHNIDAKSETFVQDSSGEWVKCAIIWHDADFDCCYLKPAKPVVGVSCKDGLPAWIGLKPFRVVPVQMLGSLRFSSDVPFGGLAGASGGGIFVKGKLVGILSNQRRCEDGTVSCIICPLFAVEALSRK